jgi:ParB family chromosome partitioning protein
MAGGNKKQFIRRGTSPRVASTDEFEEIFARRAETRRHQLIDIPIDRIDPSPFQIRQDFDDIDELATTMRRHGFTSHLWVREHPTVPGRYQLVYGERRLRAAQRAGIMVIPCEVTQYDDREMLEIGLTENLQRQDLKPLEEAHGLKRFIEEFDYSVRTLAERIGKDKGYVENRLRLLRLPEDVQEMVGTRPDTMSAAREVARLPTREARAPIIDGLIKDGLSLKTAHVIVDAALEQPDQAAAVVVEQIAEHRARPQHEPAPPLPGGKHVEKELKRDWSRMMEVLERWQARLPSLTEEQRSELRKQIHLVSSALEELAELAR